MPDVRTPDVEAVFRESYGRAVAVLTRLLGDIDAAEEAVQDAFTTALDRWPRTGLPPRPGLAPRRGAGRWLNTTWESVHGCGE